MLSMVKSVRLISGSLLFFMLALPSYAFEPAKHGEFARRAAEVYQTCTGRAITPGYISAFAEGSVHEDNPTLSRVLNWHFYNRDKKIGHYWKYFLYCDGSNEHIFNERLNALKDMINAKKPLKDIYEMAGRIAHHIQEMSSPPHVVPIYHVYDDRFDTYEPVNLPVFDSLTICKDLKDSIHKPPELLEQASQHTLKIIEGTIESGDGKIIEGETWINFWGGPEDQELAGFKTYGKYGNVFGENPPCKNESCGAFNRGVYDRFYNECYRRAVTDTVRLLIYLDQEIAK